MTDDPFATNPSIPVDANLLEALIQNVGLAADSVAMEFRGTPADQTRAVIRAAFANAVYNGAITIAPEDSWPVWWDLDVGITE